MVEDMAIVNIIQRWSPTRIVQVKVVGGFGKT
jgi:hypothetical protein